ncbi:MAG: efflux RND transporter permease subunit [Chlamydiota bacterium]
MIRFFVKHPITTIMFVLFFVVLGAISFSSLQVEKNPKIDFPVVTVKAVYPGATPVEVESSVIKKVEDAVAELAGIEKIRSQSSENFGFVFIEFNLSTDINNKFIEVKDKVEALLNDFPDEVHKPIIEKFDPLVQPVTTIVLENEKLSMAELYEIADHQLKDQFGNIQGVANVDISGGQERQINITLDPILMKQSYVDIRDVIQSIKAKNKNIPGGLLEKDERSLNLRFIGEFQNTDEIGEMTIISREGKSVTLKDIGSIEFGTQKISTIARYNGKNVIALSLTKISDGNAVEIAQSVKKRLPQIQAALPSGSILTIATDTTSFILEELRDAQWSIILGIILTVTVLYLFTGNIISTIIAAVVIPTSIISAFLLVKFSGFSINFLTMLSVATVLGTLIANAIIIIENCLENIQNSDDTAEAVIQGTQEVLVAVLASTGTNLVVFAPLAFMGGIVGQFMSSFGWTVIYITLFSLIISFTLTPMLCAKLLRKKRLDTSTPLILRPLSQITNGIDKLIDKIIAEYKVIFKILFRFPKTSLMLIIIFVFSSFSITSYIGSSFRPAGDEGMINLSMSLPQGSTIAKTSDTVKNIEQYISKIPEVTSTFSNIGQNGIENAHIAVNLESFEQRQRSDAQIIEELIPFIATIPDLEVSISRGAGDSSDMGDLSLYVYGDDFDRLAEISNKMRKKMEDSGFFHSLISSYKPPKDEIRFIPDPKSLTANGVRDVEIGSVMRASVFGDTSNIFKNRGLEYNINVQLAEQYAQDLEDVKQINIITRKGLMPIIELGSLEYRKATPKIIHRNKQKGVQIDGFLAKSSAGHVREELDALMAGIDFDEGYGYLHIGNVERQDESSREISKAFKLAVILTFMLLAAIMNSFAYPIPIILSIAASFSGVFYFLFFSGETINVASMLGFVMLVGLVVNNSILLLEYAIQKVEEGTDVKDALWEAVVKRFKPIMMTSIAIILGVLPQMFSIMPVKSSMGAVMIGGMLASVLFTFLLSPIVFWYIVRIKRFLSKRLSRP